MGKGFAIFWLIFIGYFIFIHPAIIYYNSGYENVDLSTVSPTTAFAMLALSVLLWLAVFILSLWLVLRYTYFAKRNIRSLQQEGKRMRAKVLEVKTLKTVQGNSIPKTLLLELVNFEGETVRHSMSFTDSKPEMHRFQAGSTIYLRVDPTFRKMPSVVLEDSFGSVNVLFFVLWIFFLAAASYYFQFSYQLENAGYGWRFLSWWHPLIIIPLCCLFFPGLIFWLIKVVFLKKMNLGKEMTVLKFKGKKAWASIIHVEQTGTLINDQPELRFQVEFLDVGGRKVSGEIKKIVSLIDIAHVRTQKEAFVFYDPSNPQHVAFEEDINKH